MRQCDFDAPDLNLGFHESIDSRRDLLDEATDRIMQSVRALPCAQENLDDVNLALSEAIANAIIHGNREDPGKKVQVCGTCESPGQLLLVITDEGHGFDPAVIPDPTRGDNLFSSHGRGVFLMNRLMDQTEFRLGGRQVVLRKRASKIP